MQTYPPGTRIGQYEIASRPMMGGMGVVYFAFDHGNDGRPVAIKTFRPELLPDRTARDRFLREGTAWVELGSHPNIVRCYSVEYHDPIAFLVLELIAKEQNMPDASLRSWLIPGRPLPLDQALLFALQIARGMQYASEKLPGFVHRDLKPENILVGADTWTGTNINRLRVTDFGLVKTFADSGMLPTTNSAEELKPNQVQFTRWAGTPLYMAPEQWKNESVGVFTDVYSFGCILYEMLSGQRPAEGRSQPMAANLPSDVAEFIIKCLELNPTNRYVTWNEILDNLERVHVIQSRQLDPQEVTKEEMNHEDRAQAAWSFIAIGAAYSDMGKVEVATRHFKNALEIAREISNRNGEAAALNNLGIAYKNLGDVQQAIGYFEQVLAMVHEVGDRSRETAVLTNLGIAYKHLGDMQRAIDYLEQALAIAHEMGDRSGETHPLGNLGNVYLGLGDAQRAIGYFEQSLAIAHEMGDRRGEIADLTNLGIAYKHLGDMQRAIGHLEQALAMAHEMADRSGEAYALGNLGNVYLELGDAQQATDYSLQQLAITREIGNRRGEAAALTSLGIAYEQMGDVQRALGFFEQALAMAHEMGDRSGKAHALGNLGNVYFKLGDVQRAIGYLEQSLALARQIGNRRGEGMALGNLGIMYSILGDRQLAIEYYEKQTKIAREIGDLHGVGNSLSNMAVEFMKLDNNAHAMRLAQEALQIFIQIGSPNMRAIQQLVDKLSTALE